MKRSIGMVAAIVALLIGFAKPSASQPASSTVPIELTNTRHIVVQVKIDDTGPYRLVFDTGSPLTFIGGRAAQKAGLITAERAKQPAFFGMRGQFNVKRFQLGGVEVPNLKLMVLDHPIIDLLSQYEGPIDGIVGYSFFARYRTTIDYAAGTIKLVAVDYQPQDVMTGLMGQLFNQPTGAKILTAPALWGLEIDRPDDEPGVRVTRVYSGSAAAAAGLKTGDRITTLGGWWTDSAEDFHNAAGEVKPGESAELRVQRLGNELTLKVRPRVGI